MFEQVLTDVQSGIFTGDFHLDSGNGPKLAGAANWSICKRTMRGGTSDGMDIVSVDNGMLQVEVLPTRGMGLWRGSCQGLELGWQSPVTLPVHPALVNLHSAGGLGWLRGFNEWIVRCGLTSLGPPGIDVHHETGAETPLTLHGTIANTPAHHVAVRVTDGGPGTLSLTGIVDEAAMFGPALRLTSCLRTEAGSPTLSIVDEVTNCGDQPQELQLMYHCNFGRPLLESGARANVAARQIACSNRLAAQSIERWQAYGDPTPGISEEVYFFAPLADSEGMATAMLQNAAGDQGISISFPVNELPCFTLWKRPGGLNEGYVTGLEPSTSYPNLKSFERQRGRVVLLAPEETYRTSVEITVLADQDCVAATRERIAELQGDRPPVLHTWPHPDFNPTSE